MVKELWDDIVHSFSDMTYKDILTVLTMSVAEIGIVILIWSLLW